MDRKSFGGKPKTSTPADRRLKENKGLPVKTVPVSTPKSPKSK